MDTSTDTADTLSIEVLARLRNVLAARPPGSFMSLDEASVYTGLAERTLRNLAQKGALPVDGRGRKRTPLWRRSTLDRFLSARAG